MANPVRRFVQAIRSGLAAAVSVRRSRRAVTHARALEPALSPEFDFSLMADVDGPYFVNWKGRRVPVERVRTVAADLDRLLAHIADPEAGIPDDTSRFRNPWTGQPFAMQDPQLGGATIDVNLSRRAGLAEVDIPTGLSEQPVCQSVADIERLATVFRRMLALWEDQARVNPATPP